MRLSYLLFVLGGALCAVQQLAAQLGTEGHRRSWGVRVGNEAQANTPPPAPLPPSPPVVVVPVYQPVIGPPAPIPDITQQPQTPILVDRTVVISYDDNLPHEINVVRNINPNSAWSAMPTHSNGLVVTMAKEALRDPRVQAFLDIIARAEVADQTRRDDAYKILHGFGMLREYTRLHPGIKSHGATAAGRYQFTQKTFNPIYYRYPSADLSFHPPGQDLAAVILLHERGILRFIARDDIVGAVRQAAKTWAGLPYYEDGDRTGNRSYYRGVHKNRSTFGFEVAEQHYQNRLMVYQSGVANVYIPPQVQIPPQTPVPTTPVVTPPVNPVPNSVPTAPRGSWRVGG